MVPCFSFGECELVGRMWKACGGVTNLFSFSNIFFPIFFYILSLVSRRCGLRRSFNVWNSSFRSKNGELGRSVGSWNRLSAPWTCLFRQLKMVHGANQREPRVLFSVKNDRHQSRGDVCTFHQYAFIRSAGVINRARRSGYNSEAAGVFDTGEEASILHSRECRRCLGWLGCRCMEHVRGLAGY